MSAETHDDWRPYVRPQRVEKRFVVSGTAEGFQTVVDLAAARLRENFKDGGWYGLKCFSPFCQHYEIVKQWPSKVDPERTHESQVVWFSIRQGGEKLLVIAEYTQTEDEPNEQADLVFSLIAAHYPESELSVLQAPAQLPPIVTEKLGSYQYWKEIHRQAQASGNVKGYLQQKDISRATYYDNVRKHGLSGVSGKAGQKSDTKPDT
jgi:hypothetical protein